VRSYRTFSPLLAANCKRCIFCGTFRSVRVDEPAPLIGAKTQMIAHPRPLAGMLPYEDRTFLSTHSQNERVQRLPDRAGNIQYRIAQNDGARAVRAGDARSAGERIVDHHLSDDFDRLPVQQRRTVAPLSNRVQRRLREVVTRRHFRIGNRRAAWIEKRDGGCQGVRTLGWQCASTC